MANPIKPRKPGRPVKDREVVPLTREVGQPLVGLTQQALIQDSADKDLALPRRWCVIDRMAQDDAVFSANYATNIECSEALNNYRIKAKTSLGETYAEFIRYNFANFESGTFYEFINNALLILRYGFSPINNVFQKRLYGPYANTYCIHKLSPRDPRSVYCWLYDDNYREVIGFAQHKNNKKYLNSHTDYKEKMSWIDFSNIKENEYSVLKKNQYIHFRHNPYGGNPQGDSPYLHCYTAWAEKKVAQKLQVLGLTKDLGGCFIARAPGALFEKAMYPEQYPDEAKEILDFQKNVSDLQNGNSSMLVLLSDVDTVSGKYLYDLEIKGLDGGGRQFDTVNLITEYNKAIYNVFGAAHLILGQNGQGSNALFNGADLTHSSYCRTVVEEIADVINTQLIPRLLAVNGIFPSPKDMPVFLPGDVVGISYDELGKFIQRTKSVNALTPELMKEILEIGGFTTEGVDKIDFTDKGDSRSGDGKGTSGTGSSQSGGANSATNVENKSSIILLEDRKEEGERIYFDLKTNRAFIEHE